MRCTANRIQKIKVTITNKEKEKERKRKKKKEKEKEAKRKRKKKKEKERKRKRKTVDPFSTFITVGVLSFFLDTLTGIKKEREYPVH